jgi:hypothetical protein
MNTAINWTDPNNTPGILDGNSFTYQAINVFIKTNGLAAGTSVTPQQFMNESILHELTHLLGKVDPDDPTKMKAIWTNCNP